MVPLSRLLTVASVVLFFAASQLFWVCRLRELLDKFVHHRRWRRTLSAAGLIAYLVLLVYNLPWAERSEVPTHLTLRAALLEAPFRWWLFGSVLGFVLVAGMWTVYRVVWVVSWAWAKTGARFWERGSPEGAHPGKVIHPPASPEPAWPSRRRFLEQTALAAGAAPFVAGAYGLVYGRLNLETTRVRLTLDRLPKAFHGFRIAQLSDVHIGPFMSAEEIRRYVEIANRLKPDLFVLTGDFVTWDPKTQGPVVKALAGLKAPFGLFGCLGNHELWTDTQDSITRLFAAEDVKILRHAREAIQSHGAVLNLIGVDFQTRGRMGAHAEGLVSGYLRGIEPLIMPGTVNILLSHNPNTFDRAAEAGIDLSLAGHTHGGQVTLEFVHPSLSPGRLITPYVRGWFRKPGGAQLYVNRGIGTIGVPIRMGAPPEITVLELVGKA